jgi:CelD/BcsL family acetyltransferase involved in cellulose biosynthesis
VRIEVVRPGDLGEGDVAAWRAIQARAGLDNPFLGPEFAQIVGRQRDDARVAVMLDDGRPAGFFAYERRRLRVGKPIGAGLSDCQAVVAEPELDWDPGDLLVACDLAVWEFDHLVAAQPQFAGHHAEVVPSFVMDLSGGYEAFCAAVAARSKSFIPRARRGIRRLEREVGPVRLEYDDPSQEAHRTIQAWKSAQYRRSGRPDRFSRPWISALVADLLATRTETFQCRCSTLYAGDRVVAGQINLHSPRVIALWVIAYDTEVRRAGPGNVADLLIAEEAARRGIAYIDMGRDDTPQKLRIGTGEIPVAEGCVERRGVVAISRRAWRTPVRATHRAIVRHPPVRRAVKRALRTVGGLLA